MRAGFDSEITIRNSPPLFTTEKIGRTEENANCFQYETVMMEIASLRAEVQKHSELIRSKPVDMDTENSSNGSEDRNMWNLNSVSVLMWRTCFWPSGQQWNHDKEQFEKHLSPFQVKSRSRSQIWIESSICPLLFTISPMLLVFVEICILSGIVDQGSSVKTHIYGDGFYQSPIWRYSGSAYLRVKFVPFLNSSGVRIGMTSDVDVFNHSMLKERPASEALQCLDNNYIMPFNRYQACVCCLDLKRRNTVAR